MASHRRTFAAALATAAASVSLYPVFMGALWFWAGLGAVTVAALAGTATRLRRLPASACLAGGAIAQLLYLNLAFANARSLYHVLPTPASVRLLWDTAGRGLAEAAAYAPPVPELPGMVVLAAGAIGITAMLTDLIAVRLGSAALAGLPLLLVFAEPAMLGIDRGFTGTAIAFAAGAGGYLTLLRGEGRDRIRDWAGQGQPARATTGTPAPAATGRRVAFASVLLALFVPLMIPGLHVTPLVGGQPGTGGNAGGGGAVAGFPDPNTQLSSELRMTTASNVLTYTTTSPAPDYLQVYVLDKLTSDGWQLFSQPESLVRADPRLPAPTGLATGPATGDWLTTVTTRIAISPDVSQDALSALPVPYPATSLSVPGMPLADRSTLMVFDPSVALGGLRYTVTSLSAAPPGQLLNSAPRPPASVTGHYLRVPASYGQLRAIAESVVRAAGAGTPFQKAVAIQDWLTSGSFRYALDAPTVASATGLANFLKVTKRGYCQQFSFAMAVLARLAGIPSRVAYGFTSGTPIGGDEWLVTTHDAHAWPELYFQGIGWLRFEPTPAGPAGQGTATTPSYALAPMGATPGSDSPAAPSAAPSATAAPGSPGQSALRHLPGRQSGSQGGTAGAGPASGRAASPWQALGLALAALLALALAAPRCARLLIRRHRWNAGRPGAGTTAGDAALASAAWRELRDDLADHAIGYPPSQSPRAVAKRMAASLVLTGQARAALDRIALAEERARYSASPADGSGLREDSATVRRAIAAAMPRRTRWQAMLAPASVLGRLSPQWPGRLRARIFRAPARASRLP